MLITTLSFRWTTPQTKPARTLAVADAPQAVCATLPVQVLPFTTHDFDPAAHGVQAGGEDEAAHEAFVGGPQPPPELQENVAEPVVPLESLMVTVLLGEVGGRVPVQVLPPTLQLAGWLGQLEAAELVHDSFECDHAPLLQVKSAAPVVGVVLSVTFCEVPLAPEVTLPLQVLPLTVQDTLPALQGEDDVEHVVLVAGPQVPFVHRNRADPVAGAVASVAVALAPSAVLPTLPVQLVPLTVHDLLPAAHEEPALVEHVEPGASVQVPLEQL